MGYLLHKNPARLHTFDLAFGKAHVFYPEASESRCTAALLLDIDPVGLVRRRNKGGGDGGVAQQYVNDRPYVASSFLSVAIGRVFGSALAGNSKGRPELANAAIPLTAGLETVPCHGGEKLLRRLFEPLGYQLTAEQHPLDDQFPDWGPSRYFRVTLNANSTVRDLLTHLYVLLPVLDDAKHYWVGDDEVEKLLRRGGDWLAAHPERDLIADRYLKHQRSLARQAVARLREQDEPDPDEVEASLEAEEEAVEKPLGLNDQRVNTVLAALRSAGARRVLDLGCGSGKLLGELFADKSFEQVTGLDVSFRSLDLARRRLRLDHLGERQTRRVTLLHGSLTYGDQRLKGYDAATLVEVVEHIDPFRLPALERVVFEDAHPATVIVTTPNIEYNVRFETLPAGSLRHRDHRFEWTRLEFQAWAESVAARCRYAIRFVPVGSEDAAVGPPTQMAVFSS